MKKIIKKSFALMIASFMIFSSDYTSSVSNAESDSEESS